MTNSTGVYTSGGTLNAPSIRAGDITAGSITLTDRVVVNLRVEQIDNGFLVHMFFCEMSVAHHIYIKELEELPDVLTARLVAKRMGA
jgi:hypothetical protein